MPGVQINQLPIITEIAGTESVPLQPNTGNRITSQISTLSLAQGLAGLIGESPFNPANYLSGIVEAGLTSNWNPVGFGITTAILRVSSSNVAASIDGLKAPNGSVPQLIGILNCNTADADISLIDASDSVSDGQNQFLIDRQVTIAIGFQGAVWCWYDPVSEKWRVLI